MKRLVILLLAVSLGFSSCKEDFEVAAPYKNITLVYAMLNRTDTAHYFRIQKGFMDPNKGVIEMSQIADSSFYKDLTVTMKEYTNDVHSNTWTLNKVNMAAENYPKDAAGTLGFFSMPSYAYKLKLVTGDSLSPYKKYKLFVRNNESGQLDSSDFVYMVASNNNTTSPSEFQVNDFIKTNFQLSFAKTDLKSTYNIIVRAPKNAKVIEGVIRFNMVEKNLGTGQIKRLPAADFYFDQQTRVNPEVFSLTTLNSSIYAFLRDAYGAAPANTARYIDSCDMRILAGGFELYNYMLISSVQNSSLLGDQIKPFYTNIHGDNSYGLVTSRAISMRKNIAIDNVTLDSLKINPITISMNIAGRSDD